MGLGKLMWKVSEEGVTAPPEALSCSWADTEEVGLGFIGSGKQSRIHPASALRMTLVLHSCKVGSTLTENHKESIRNGEGDRQRGCIMLIGP